MTQIVGFAGKKQSGKNTACNYILALKLAELGISKNVRLSADNNIEVTDVFGETKEDQEWFEFSEKNLSIKKLFDDSLGKYIRIYGLADTLKDICVDVLGLSKNQAYGSDEEKNSLTDIQWKNMPNIVNANGFMTAREVLQHVGTDIFRKIDPDVWINSLLRKIRRDKPEVALICDVRFKNEILSLQNDGGYIIGLTRDPYKSSDGHSSETEIEECLDMCDKIVDNHGCGIEEQLNMIREAVSHLPNVLPIMEK